MLQHRINEHRIDASSARDSASPLSTSNANSTQSHSDSNNNNNFNQQQMTTNLLSQLLPNNMQLPFLMSNGFGDLDVSKLAALPNGQNQQNVC